MIRAQKLKRSTRPSASADEAEGEAKKVRQEGSEEAEDADDAEGDEGGEGGTIAAPCELSERERVASSYTMILQEGLGGVGGIMAKTDSNGLELLPYRHQRRAVKRSADKSCTVLLLAHGAGTGKTATFLQAFAALELVLGGGASAIISAPPATLGQWEASCHDWLNLPNKEKAIFVTNKLSDITEDVMRAVRVLVVSRHLISRAFKLSFEVRERASASGPGGGCRVNAWVRKPGVGLHAIFLKSWSLCGVDECHFHRNPASEWSVSQAYLSSKCLKRIGLSATPVVNRPLDLAGICSALGAPSHFQNKSFWTIGENKNQLDPNAVLAFRQYLDRVKDEVLDLPSITHNYYDFDPELPPRKAAVYNAIVASAKELKQQMFLQKATVVTLQKLMGYLTKLQQLLVSPLLAERGAIAFNNDEMLYDEAARHSTGALTALHNHIVELQGKGHRRIIVASNHVAVMKVAAKYLKRQSAAIGRIFLYDGTLSLARRQAEKHAFLTSDRSILFLSIGAGGTGLHLVPGCQCIVFWGARPFSPASILQTSKRIHRIGQEHAVTIRHLISTGSVDSAICNVHADKERLSAAVLDDDWSSFSDDSPTSWKKTGRIVDGCTTIRHDGRFRTAAEEKMLFYGGESAASAAATPPVVDVQTTKVSAEEAERVLSAEEKE